MHKANGSFINDLDFYSYKKFDTFFNSAAVHMYNKRGFMILDHICSVATSFYAIRNLTISQQNLCQSMYVPWVKKQVLVYQVSCENIQM